MSNSNERMHGAGSISSVILERKHVPIDLESRLRKAWLLSQSSSSTVAVQSTGDTTAPLIKHSLPQYISATSSVADLGHSTVRIMAEIDVPSVAYQNSVSDDDVATTSCFERLKIPEIVSSPVFQNNPEIFAPSFALQNSFSNDSMSAISSFDREELKLPQMDSSPSTHSEWEIFSAIEDLWLKVQDSDEPYANFTVPPSPPPTLTLEEYTTEGLYAYNDSNQVHSNNDGVISLTSNEVSHGISMLSDAFEEIDHVFSSNDQSYPSLLSSTESEPSLCPVHSPSRQKRPRDNCSQDDNHRTSVPRKGLSSAMAEVFDEQMGVEGTSEKVVDLLVGVAQAIVLGDKQKAMGLLEKLQCIASVYGDASQRMSAYFLEGLSAKIDGAEGGKVEKRQQVGNKEDDTPSECDSHIVKAFQVLLSSTPLLTFGQVAVNCALLETFVGAERVHIVDFGIGHGLQWPPLLQALASRPQGPPHVRITGIDLPVWGTKRAYCVIETGLKLKNIAAEMGIPFEYHGIGSLLENITSSQIRSFPGEVMAVNCNLRLSQLLDKSVTPSDPRGRVLRLIRELNPAVFTLVEQHTNHNSPFFLSRFYEALYYYSSVFDSLEASLPAELAERQVFEREVLGKAIVNVLACEGQNRVQRQETIHQWQVKISQHGFASRPVGENIVEITRQLLETYREGYSMTVEEQSRLMLMWRGVPMIGVLISLPNV